MYSKNLIIVICLSIIFGAQAVYGQQKSTVRVITGSPGFGFDESGYLGVQTIDVTKENAQKFGLSEVRGVAVERVIENTAASKAGLAKGDVIVSINDEEISSVRKLTRVLGEIAPDHAAKITVLRKGTQMDLSATLEKRPVPKFDGAGFNIPRIQRSYGDQGTFEVPDFPPPGLLNRPDVFIYQNESSRRIGVSVEPLNKQMSEFFGAGDGGLLIKEVVENSPSAKAGLKAGDVIVEIDGKPVSKMFDIQKLVNAKKEGDVRVTIVREKNRQEITVTPEKTDIAPTKTNLQNLLKNNQDNL